MKSRMRRQKTLGMALAAGAVATSLLLGAGMAHAAGVRLQGLRTVDLGVQTSFLVNAFTDDVGSLSDWDSFQVNLELSGQSGATGAVFSAVNDVTGRDDYVFADDSGGYSSLIFPDGTVAVAAGETASGNGVAPAVDKILAQVRVDVSNAQPGQTYDITLEPAFLNFFEDATANGEGITLSEPYSFTVVPIPAAVWLFGSGLVAFGAIARRRRMAA